MIGHKLWCDIVVKKPEVAPEEKTKEVPVPAKVEDLEQNMAKLNIEPEVTDTAPIDHSQVVFPKLDKESPSASVHQEDTQSQAESRPEEEDYEECEDVEWDEDASESYMTDEEYDILDASDEESVAAPRK
jgi:next-to-BRCA1 protein 1